jgi:beta-galactosidase
MLVHVPVPEGHKEAVSYWGWPDELNAYTFPGAEGKSLQVHVYTKYDTVRLMLNGKTIGEQSASAQTKFMATFNINYEPGQLKAIGIKNGNAVDSVVLKTVGKPAGIRLIPDRKNIKANAADLAYVTAEIIDANGNVVPYASQLLHFTINGNGKIIATGNANPSGVESMQQPQHKTFNGKCLAIIQPNGNAGKIMLKAEGAGLKETQITISTQ